MNHAIPLPHTVPLRIRILLLLTIAYSFTSAVSLAPTFGRTIAAASLATHSQVCKCAHCSGGAACCCRLAGKCAN
jgi:hypothetical protein